MYGMQLKYLRTGAERMIAQPWEKKKQNHLSILAVDSPSCLSDTSAFTWNRLYILTPTLLYTF